ncbi:MAG: hypothetical protein ICV79_17635 [Flavisolibacter sp.]|nr:hypothetical protein [Flavisolibacter sp.]
MDADQSAAKGASDRFTFHPVLRLAARVVSVIFHPLFIPVYISWFIIYTYPLFPALNGWEKNVLLLRFFVMYSVFPLVTVLLARGLGFIRSIYLKTQKDRIIPYVACGVYYFWMWYVLHHQSQLPKEVVMLALAIFIASSAGLFINSYIKISMHSIAAGVMVAFIMTLALLSDAPFGVYISVALFIAGLVSTARLITDDHHPIEIYAGLAIGVVAEVVAYFIVL